jgi:hypothetical protein
MRPANCVFCGVLLSSPGSQQPDSRTKEHVYARWYRANVVNDKIKIFTSDGKNAYDASATEPRVLCEWGGMR